MTEIKDEWQMAFAKAYATRPHVQVPGMLSPSDINHMLEAVAPLIAAEARREALKEVLSIAEQDADDCANVSTIRRLIQADAPDALGEIDGRTP